MPATHEVLNQPPELPEYDLYATDPILPEAVAREGAGWAEPRLSEFGVLAGTYEVREWGFQANRHGPVLHTHDRFGRRLDQVEFHPSWHSLMELSVRHGVHSLGFEDAGPEGSIVARTALMYLDSQMEQGHGCPISMTSSVLLALRNQPEVAAAWEPLVLSRAYDPRFAPPGDKAGVLLGMGMTEKQGGSDVRANTTRAVPDNGGGPGGAYRLTGHKWFTSAPQCDAFLVLAQAPGGLSCFLLPRFTPAGEVNAFHIQRLKDKLGNRSNASSEVEYDRAWAVMVGEEGRGVATIIEMVNGTRLDCTIGAAAIMRQAVTQAAHHVGHRSAFGDVLADKPLMRAVIADLEVETEAATLLMMRVAGAFDRAEADVSEALLKRIVTPVAKYWVSKRCTPVVHEALECLGGGGYVEDSMMPRLFRESPLNAIWEGSGNVIALDLLRAMVREPKTVDAFLDEAETARGADRRLDAAFDGLRRSLTSISEPERVARRLIEQMALAMQGSLVVRYGSASLADAFCASRLDGDWGHLFGTLPPGLDLDPLVEAARVA
jgi:putative acyl-CoA dehydrogenase